MRLVAALLAFLLRWFLGSAVLNRMLAIHALGVSARPRIDRFVANRTSPRRLHGIVVVRVVHGRILKTAMIVQDKIILCRHRNCQPILMSWPRNDGPEFGQAKSELRARSATRSAKASIHRSNETAKNSRAIRSNHSKRRADLNHHSPTSPTKPACGSNHVEWSSGSLSIV